VHSSTLVTVSVFGRLRLNLLLPVYRALAGLVYGFDFLSYRKDSFRASAATMRQVAIVWPVKIPRMGAG